MSFLLRSLHDDAVFEDPRAMQSVRNVAGEIAKDANKTDAKIGITYRDNDDGKSVRVGPRGAPAIVVEVGGKRHSARRPVKRALDRRRKK